MIKLPCSAAVTRWILLILNIIFLIFSIALLGFGIYLRASKKFDVALTHHINAQILGGTAIGVIGVILIIVGICTLILSLFGCLGAFLQNRVFLFLYAAILVIVMLLELGAFIGALVARTRIRNSYESGLMHIFRDAYDNDKIDLIKQIEDLEVEFSCCGVIDSQDYAKVNTTIPRSCYESQSEEKQIWEKGCADAFIDWMWDELPVISGIIGFVLFLEIFGVIASIVLGVIISTYSYGQLHGRL